MNEADQLEHRRHNEHHNCVVIGCNERARTAYIAAADGDLAGFTWQQGDFIDFCWLHAAMLYAGLDPMWGAI